MIEIISAEMVKLSSSDVGVQIIHVLEKMWPRQSAARHFKNQKQGFIRGSFMLLFVIIVTFNLWESLVVLVAVFEEQGAVSGIF